MKKILLGVIISSLLLEIACTNTTQNNYTKANVLIEQREWMQALDFLERASGYKDASVLSKYVLAEMSYNKIDLKSSDNHQYETTLGYLSSIPDSFTGEKHELINVFKNQVLKEFNVKQLELIVSLLNKSDYKNALIETNYGKKINAFSPIYEILNNYILAKSMISDVEKLDFERKSTLMVEKLRTIEGYMAKIPYDYNEVLHEEILEDKDSLFGLEKKYLENVVHLISNKEYERASTLLFNYNIVDSFDSEEKEALENYADALINQNKNSNQMVEFLAKIPQGYSGLLSNEINQIKNNYKNQIAKEIESNKRVQIYLNKSEAKIGMTEEEVRNSRWGSPKEINKTETKYGVREQWVYSMTQFIYFKDGVVTAIQE